jgi:arylsulfatase A-like enzyme
MSKKPNVVFLLNDHQAYYRHGWDSGPKIQRPHFDRLASEGVLFHRAYTAAPLCGPARRTMLTGLLPHNHGEIKNDSNHPYDREVYLDILAANGYRNYYYGKWHAGAGTAFDHRCEGFSYPSYNNPYTKPEYKEYLAKRGLPEPEILIEHSFWGDRPINKMKVGELYRQENPWCNEHGSGVMQTPNDSHEAFFLANLACEKLRELADSDSDEPFHLRVDFWGPHQPYFPTREFAEMYNPAEIPEYGSFRDDLEDKPDVYRIDGNHPISKGRRLIQPNPLPWSQWQEVIARSYAQTTLTDAAGGRILDALDELGLADNTIVIWTTDHGDGLACHGGHFDKSSYMPEEMLRIPMALRFPGQVKAGQETEGLVSNLDVAPTMLDAAGLGFERGVDGRSLLPLCKGGTADWRRDFMCETHGHGMDHLGRILITGRYKYVWNHEDMDELYDLREDPYEMTNLVDEPAHKAALEGMKARLAEWQRASGDTPFSSDSFWRQLLREREARSKQGGPR